MAAWMSMRPPAALKRPRLITSPGEAFSFTLTLGVMESSNSRLEPAANRT